MPQVTTSWEILRLGTFGGDYSEAYDINDLGQVVGIAGKPGNASFSGFVWKRATNQMLELPPAPDPGRPSTIDGGSIPRSINNTGKIVGFSDRWIDLGQGVGQTYVATVWDVDTLAPTPLGLPGYSSLALDVNDQGMVIGVYSFVPNGPEYAFVWNLNTGTYTSSVESGAGGYAINNSGLGVGSGFVWNTASNPWSSSALTGCGSQIRHGREVNSAGVVVGYCEGVGSWSFNGSSITNLPNASWPASAFTVANDINDQGTVVGFDFDSTFSASRSGILRQFVAWSQLPLPANTITSDAVAINNLGAIAGSTTVDSASTGERATVWLPAFGPDTEAPTMRVLGVEAGQEFAYGQTPQVSCLSVDNVGVVVQPTLGIAGGPEFFTASCNGAKDAAGNLADPVSVNYRISQTAPDTIPPVVMIVGVASGGVYPLGLAPAIGCTTTDTQSSVTQQAYLSSVTSNGNDSYTATCSGGQDAAGNVASPISATFSMPPLYRARQVRSGNGNAVPRVYVERNVAVAGLNDYDPDGDGWALVGQTNGGQANGYLDNILIDGSGRPLVVVDFNNNTGTRCYTATPDLTPVKSGPNRTFGRQNDPANNAPGCIANNASNATPPGGPMYAYPLSFGWQIGGGGGGGQS